MPRYDTMQGALPLLVLKILARRGPLHGYAITRQIEIMSDNVLRVEQGSLYPALHRMEEAGWIKARWAITGHNRRAREYELTAAGRRQLDAERARWDAVTGAVGHILKHA
jgi:transcriptional regulator